MATEWEALADMIVVRANTAREVVRVASQVEAVCGRGGSGGSCS
jgi:hypothetical protein